MKHLFTNILGTFVFENNQLKDQILFKDLKDYLDKEKFEQKLTKKYKKVFEPKDKDLEFILAFFKDKKYFKQFYQKNLLLTKQQIKQSVQDDNLIIQTISSIKELDRLANVLIKRLREWSELYLPEFSKSIQDQEKFIELIQKKNRKQILKELKLTEETTMGKALTKTDIDEILALAKQAASTYQLRRKQEIYLEKIMKKFCPNILELCGSTIGAKLIEAAGSLKRLATFPSSTVQLLGAEKALFRHIKTGAKSPKHGYIKEHLLVQNAKEKGKAARALADKISLAARLDFFKGEFKAKQMRKELEKKIKQ
ncbi:MAG: NOP58 family protein [Nanoarchaeota archaeon]|nr:NOP58 family protein [Nanoarchaeota archaeon]